MTRSIAARVYDNADYEKALTIYHERGYQCVTLLLHATIR